MMKLTLTFGLTLTCLWGALSAQAQNLLDGPVEVTFDSLNNRWLVSSAFNNSIVSIDESGTQSLFYTMPEMPRGIHVHGSLVYVSHGKYPWGLSVIDLATGTLTADITVAGTGTPTGLTSDTSGYLYQADQDRNIIYRIKRSDLSYTSFCGVGAATGVQDVAFDIVNNRLLASSYVSGSPIISVALPGNTVTVLVAGTLGSHDGITIDESGTIYATHFWNNCIYAWDSDGTNMRLFSLNHLSGPKRLDYNPRDSVMAIPLHFSNRVDFLSLADHDEDGVLDYQDNCPDTYNPSQSDLDADAIGDACDECTDTDGDGYGNPGFAANICHLDNCPNKANPSQSDWGDRDGVGDDCDNCVFMSNSDQIDSDGDGRGDVCDCCEIRVGDANGEGEYPDEVTLADIMLLVDVKFISGDCSRLHCLHEADVNQDGGLFPSCDHHVTLADIMALVDFLLITGPENATLADCP